MKLPPPGFKQPIPDLRDENYWRYGPAQDSVADALAEACKALAPLRLDLRCVDNSVLMVAPYCNSGDGREHCIIACSKDALTDAEIIFTIRRVVAGVLHEKSK